MKTTFRPRSHNEKRSAKRLALVVGTFVLALLVFTFLRSYILIAISPLWRAENAFSTTFRNIVNLVVSKESLIRENEALKERAASYDELLASYRTLSASQDELLSRFGRPAMPGGIAAGVLMHPPATPYDIIIIDAGTKEGVKMGDKVSLPEGGALGTVQELFDHEAKVTLYSASGEETEAVLERGGVPVTLIGEGGGAFKFDLPREINVVAGDKVLLPGLRTELVGVVEEISTEPTDSAQHVLIDAVGSISSVRFVLVH